MTRSRTFALLGGLYVSQYLGIGFFYLAFVSAPYAMITPMLVDAGWSLSSIGLLVTAVAGSCALAAALGSGFLVRRLGRRRALVAFTGVQVVAVLGLLPLANGSGSAVTLKTAETFGYPSVILGSIVLLIAGGALGSRVRTSALVAAWP